MQKQRDNFLSQNKKFILQDDITLTGKTWGKFLGIVLQSQELQIYKTNELELQKKALNGN